MSSPFYEEGRYKAEIVNQGLGQAGTGNPQIVWRIRITETDLGEQLRQQYERTIYRTITENTMPYILEDLRTLGFQHESFRFLDPNQPGFQDFKGQIITVFCQHEEDTKNGGRREKWGIASEIAFEVKPLESAKLRQLDNLFGKQLKGLAGAKPPTPMPNRAPAPVAAGGVSDDDVPF